MATKKIKPLYVNLLLDQSGSMGSVYGETLQGFNSYVDKLKEQKNPTYFTLTKFNDKSCKPSYVAKPITKVPKLTNKNYKPEQQTPLYDAIGKTISALDRKITRDKLDGKILFVVTTDGYENASREYDRKKIAELVKEKTAKGWEFVFMGADIDAWGVSSGLGFQKGNTLRYASVDTVSNYANLAGATRSYSDNKSVGGQFFSGNT